MTRGPPSPMQTFLVFEWIAWYHKTMWVQKKGQVLARFCYVTSSRNQWNFKSYPGAFTSNTSSTAVLVPPNQQAAMVVRKAIEDIQEVGLKKEAPPQPLEKMHRYSPEAYQMIISTSILVTIPVCLFLFIVGICLTNLLVAQLLVPTLNSFGFFWADPQVPAKAFAVISWCLFQHAGLRAIKSSQYHQHHRAGLVAANTPSCSQCFSETPQTARASPSNDGQDSWRVWSWTIHWNLMRVMWDCQAGSSLGSLDFLSNSWSAGSVSNALYAQTSAGYVLAGGIQVLEASNAHIVTEDTGLIIEDLSYTGCIPPKGPPSCT